MKHPIRYRLELALTRLFWSLFSALPVAKASSLGAALAAMAGRLPPLARRAENNLRLAMPELDAGERAKITTGVWRNLGRTMAELPHLKHFTLVDAAPGPGQIQLVGGEHLAAHLGQGQGAILFGAHLANWELLPVVTHRCGHKVHVVYRAANNPLIDTWLCDVREDIAISALAKGRTAARGILTALKQGQSIAMLVDQKMNDGIAVPFFGRMAMTAPALAQLALRQGVAVLPMRCERLEGAAFRITVMPPLTQADTGNHQGNVLALMTQVNALLEDWIRARPEQWLWLHHRWPKE